jgi:hypothetical protein
VNQIIERPAIQLSEDWMILVFLFVLVSIAYTKAFFPSRLSRTWRGYFNVRNMRQSMREESNTPKEYMLFHLSFFLLISLVLYGALKSWSLAPFGISGFLLYLICLGGVMAIYAVKSIGIYFVMFLANGDFSLHEYLYSTFLGNRFLSLILLPLAIFLVFSPISWVPYILASAAGVVVLSYLYRIIKALINAFLSGVGAFYIFFYICTLEFLPILIAIKLLMPSNGN